MWPHEPAKNGSDQAAGARRGAEAPTRAASIPSIFGEASQLPRLCADALSNLGRALARRVSGGAPWTARGFEPLAAGDPRWAERAAAAHPTIVAILGSLVLGSAVEREFGERPPHCASHLAVTIEPFLADGFESLSAAGRLLFRFWERAEAPAPEPLSAPLRLVKEADEASLAPSVRGRLRG